MSAHPHPILPLMLCLFLLGGCTSFSQPRISVGEASIVEVSDVAARMDIPVEITNPNTESIELREFQYSVVMGGQTVFRGRRATAATLSGGFVRPVVLPAIIPIDYAKRAKAGEGVSWTVSGELLYLTEGELAEILLDTGVRSPRASFAHSGGL